MNSSAWNISVIMLLISSRRLFHYYLFVMCLVYVLINNINESFFIIAVSRSPVPDP